MIQSNQLYGTTKAFSVALPEFCPTYALCFHQWAANRAVMTPAGPRHQPSYVKRLGTLSTPSTYILVSSHRYLGIQASVEDRAF